MEFLKSRPFIVAAGALVMIAVGVLVAFTIQHRNPASNAPPPASQAGLIIDVQQGAEVKRDPSQQYRCFKDGQYVGMATLEECAKKNGVLSGALDVGIDQTGALAAAEQFGTSVSPLPPGAAVNGPIPGAPPAAVMPAPPPPAAPAAAPAATPTQTTTSARGPSATCQRYDRAWTTLGEMPLNTCLQLLYAGHCERPGGALYGRWGSQSLRLVPGRVEQSRDDRTFTTLVEQGPGCTLPGL